MQMDNLSPKMEAGKQARQVIWREYQGPLVNFGPAYGLVP